MRTYGANLNLDSRLFDRHTLKYGVNWRTQKSSSNGENNEKKSDAGVYVEGIWDFSPVTLTTGLRYDRWKMKTSSNTENQTATLIQASGWFMTLPLIFPSTPA